MNIGAERAERIAGRIAENVASLGIEGVRIDVVKSTVLGILLALNEERIEEVCTSRRGPLKTYGNDVKLSEEEYEKLVEQYGEPMVKKRIEALDAYIGNRVGRNHYKNHYKTLINWLRRDGVQKRMSEAALCPECGERKMYNGYCRGCGYQV